MAARHFHGELLMPIRSRKKGHQRGKASSANTDGRNWAGAVLAITPFSAAPGISGLSGVRCSWAAAAKRGLRSRRCQR